jgi:hypothetical protein
MFGSTVRRYSARLLARPSVDEDVEAGDVLPVDNTGAKPIDSDLAAPDA